jgi:hypothetical protein
MKQSKKKTKKKEAQKPVKSANAETKTAKRREGELAEEELAGVSGGATYNIGTGVSS